MSQPTPYSVETSSDSGAEEAIALLTILVYDWAPGQSEVRLRFPAEAEPGQPNALAEQAKFRARLLADLEDAFLELGGA